MAIVRADSAEPSQVPTSVEPSSFLPMPTRRQESVLPVPAAVCIVLLPLNRQTPSPAQTGRCSTAVLPTLYCRPAPVLPESSPLHQICAAHEPNSPLRGSAPAGCGSRDTRPHEANPESPPEIPPHSSASGWDTK